MTSIEFIEVTADLEKYYGTEKEPKELNSTERKIWFEELKNMKKERYRQLIREAFKTMKFMPKLSDILVLNRNIPNPRTEEKEIEKIKCDVCKGKGFVIYTEIHEGKKYSYTARCMCDNAKSYMKFPSIKELGLVV